MENEDFMLVPAEAWHKLLSWYGMVDGQPPLERKVTWTGRDGGNRGSPGRVLTLCVCVCQVVDLPSTVKVEIYPIELFLCLHSNMENVVTSQFSRTDNICECACAPAGTALDRPDAVCLCSDAIQRAVCGAFGVAEGSECRLWMKSSDSSCERLRNLHMSVLDACLSTGMVTTRLSVPLLSVSLHDAESRSKVRLCACQTVVMETRNADGTWPSSRPQIM